MITDEMVAKAKLEANDVAPGIAYHCTADMMRAALEAVMPIVRNAALEEAAKVAEHPDGGGPVSELGFNIAAAIRALATQKPAAIADDGLGSRGSE